MTWLSLVMTYPLIHLHFMFPENVELLVEWREATLYLILPSLQLLKQRQTVPELF